MDFLKLTSDFFKNDIYHFFNTYFVLMLLYSCVILVYKIYNIKSPAIEGKIRERLTIYYQMDLLIHNFIKTALDSPRYDVIARNMESSYFERQIITNLNSIIENPSILKRVVNTVIINDLSLLLLNIALLVSIIMGTEFIPILAVATIIINFSNALGTFEIIAFNEDNFSRINGLIIFNLAASILINTFTDSRFSEILNSISMISICLLYLLESHTIKKRIKYLKIERMNLMGSRLRDLLSKDALSFTDLCVILPYVRSILVSSIVEYGDSEFDKLKANMVIYLKKLERVIC